MLSTGPLVLCESFNLPEKKVSIEQEEAADEEAGNDSRTMIAEITKEKKYQSRAFLILPMSFNVAGILGPSEQD